MSRPDDDFPVEDLKEALRSAGVGIWTWKIATGALRWSDMTLSIFELRPDEFRGDFESFMSRVHPDDRKQVQTVIGDAVSNMTQDFLIEHRLLLPDGRVKWLEGRGRVVAAADGTADRMIGTALDTTLRKTAEERLRKGEERLRLFTTHATDYVYDATISGEVALPEIVAGSFERTTGMTPQEVTDRGGWMAVVHPDDRDRSIGLISELAQARSVSNEYRIIDAAGRTRWLRDRIVPILNDEGVLCRLVGGVTDITEQRALEERLVESQRMEALARLAAGVAHDFNNLLTVLMAESSFLRIHDATPQAREKSLTGIDAALERAKNLTSSLLAFGRKNVTPALVIDLCQAVQNSRSMLVRAAGERIVIETAVDSAQINVLADPNEIHLVLLNLTLNARDAMPQGGRVLVSVKSVSLTATSPLRPSELPPGVYAQLCVCDGGAGIAADVAGKIFEPYFTTKGHGGTGLGLPTCLGIVQRYGGALSLRETSSKGSVFEILLPVSAMPLSTAAPRPPRILIGGHEHILLVEDDASVRAIAERILVDRGYKVTAVASTEEALALGAVLQAVHAVLTDLRLPGQSGLELVAQLRKSRPAVPVLVMSGHVEDPVHQGQLSEGKYPFLAKPFSVTGLLLRLREVLDAPPP